MARKIKKESYLDINNLNNQSNLGGINTGSYSAIYGNSKGNWGTIYNSKVKYVILGEEIEIDSSTYLDINTPIVIATLNVLGKPFWIELKKQKMSLGTEIDNFIEERIIKIDRDRKIDDLLE